MHKNTVVSVMLAVLLLFTVVACGEDDPAENLNGTWVGTMYQEMDGEQVPLYLKVTLSNPDFEMTAKMSNESGDMLMGQKGTYTADDSQMIITVNQEYEVTNYSSMSGEWSSVSNETATNSYTLDGDNLTVTVEDETNSIEMTRQ